MKILFVASSLNTGGIETLILRMSKWLAQNGHSVTVLVPVGGALEDAVKQYAQVYVVGKTKYQLFNFSWFARTFNDNFDIVHAFTYEAVWIGAQICNMNRHTKLVVGVYHTHAYCFYDGKNPPYFISKYFDLFDRLPEENILFMNVANQNSHAAYYKKSFGHSRVLPIAVDDNRSAISIPRKIKRDPLKLVSVGRLIIVKNYHFGVIDALAEIKKQNINVEYYIYGEGRLKDDINQYILDRGLNENVFLMGTVPYHLLPSVLEDAFAFIGMGTSLVEAAMLGVPAFAMPPWDGTGITCGFLHQLPEYSLGEEGDKKIWKEEFVNLARLPEDQYQLLCEAERKAAEVFLTDNVMAEYMSYCQSIQPTHLDIHNFTSFGILVSRFLHTKIPFLRTKLMIYDKRYRL